MTPRETKGTQFLTSFRTWGQAAGSRKGGGSYFLFLRLA